MDKVDLTQPLEAVHRDTGAVVLVSLRGKENDRGFVVTLDLRGGWYHFRLDGSHLCNACPWFIRNADLTAKPSTPSNEELTQRMEKLVRRLPVDFIPPDEWTAIKNEAAAIVSDLPKPVDPIDEDLVHARELYAQRYETFGDHANAAASRRGDWDREDGYIPWLTKAIKLGRTLAAGGTAHE